MNKHWDALDAIAAADGELFEQVHAARLELDAAEPIDWPARFRAAAEVAEGMGWIAHASDHLYALARHAKSGALAPHVVEAIGRALLGQDGGQNR